MAKPRTWACLLLTKVQLFARILFIVPENYYHYILRIGTPIYTLYRACTKPEMLVCALFFNSKIAFYISLSFNYRIPLSTTRLFYLYTISPRSESFPFVVVPYLPTYLRFLNIYSNTNFRENTAIAIAIAGHFFIHAVFPAARRNQQFNTQKYGKIKKNTFVLAELLSCK